LLIFINDIACNLLPQFYWRKSVLISTVNLNTHTSLHQRSL